MLVYAGPQTSHSPPQCADSYQPYQQEQHCNPSNPTSPSLKPLVGPHAPQSLLSEPSSCPLLHSQTRRDAMALEAGMVLQAPLCYMISPIAALELWPGSQAGEQAHVDQGEVCWQLGVPEADN